MRLVASATTRASVVVDELPYLLEGDAAWEGFLQAVWDRSLSKAPLLLGVVGSDLSMTEFLSSHGRPLLGRVREMLLEPLTVADTAALLGLGPTEAFDAHLVTGGFRRVAGEWRRGMTLDSFLREQLQESTSPARRGRRTSARGRVPTWPAGAERMAGDPDGPADL